MATIFSPFADLTPDEYRRATEVTYLGYVYGTMAALRRMRLRDRGTIVQVGSALAYRAIPLQSVYCGAKFAIRGFTDSIRSELLHDKSRVHITMVQMPALNTPQFDWARNKTGTRPQPVPPIFQPELAAKAIVFAAHARRREIYVGWSAAKAILANKIMPGLLDHYLAGKGYSGQLTDEPVPPDAPDNLYQAGAARLRRAWQVRQARERLERAVLADASSRRAARRRRAGGRGRHGLALPRRAPLRAENAAGVTRAVPRRRSRRAGSSAAP